MSDELYEKLRVYLDYHCSTGVPKAPSGVELKILKTLFTPEDAEITIQLKPTPEPVAVIAERIGKDPEEMAEILQKMAEKALIRPYPMDDGMQYSSMPFAPGIAELSIRQSDLDPQFARDWLQYLDEAFGEAFVKAGRTPIIRTLPVAESVAVGTKVVPYEQVEEIIEKGARPRCVTECWCRKTKQIAGQKSCDHPLEVCIGFGPFAQDYIDTGVGREIDDDEFRQIMKKAREAGLVHTIAVNAKSFEDLLNVCNCCTCCCSILSPMVRVYKEDFEGGVGRSTLIAKVDSGKCSGCELCIEKCQFSALSMQDGISTVREGRCVGCGVCGTFCPEDAIKLVERKQEDMADVPDTFADLLERTLAEHRADYE